MKCLTALAEYFVKIANEAIAARGKFSVALSGGNSPKKLHELLASSFHDKVEWDKVYFFFGDERYVPQTDKDSNYLMAKKALFDPLNIEQSQQIFSPVDTSLSPKEAAEKYQEEVETFFDEGELSFDLDSLAWTWAIIHMTTSLFPVYPCFARQRTPGVSKKFFYRNSRFSVSP